MPWSAICRFGRSRMNRPTNRGRAPIASAGSAAIRSEPAWCDRIDVACSEIRARPTKARSTSDRSDTASGVGVIWFPRRSKSRNVTASSKSRISRLTAGWLTPRSSAAEVMLPVTITARKASTCRALILMYASDHA
jgi:hypothetical protein